MNKIIDKILEVRHGNYCHAFEGTVDDLTLTIDCFMDDPIIQDSTLEEVIEFFQSMSIYYYDPDNPDDREEEKKLYDFSIRDYITEEYGE